MKIERHLTIAAPQITTFCHNTARNQQLCAINWRKCNMRQPTVRFKHTVNRSVQNSEFWGQNVIFCTKDWRLVAWRCVIFPDTRHIPWSIYIYTCKQKISQKGIIKTLGRSIYTQLNFFGCKKKLRWNFGFPNIEGNSKAGKLINHAAKGL